jgi:hypothetical protein
MSYWAVYTTATGALQAVVCTPTHPRFHGYAWDGATMTATDLGAAAPDQAVMSWSSSAKAFAEDPAKVEALLVPQVKAEAERRRMLLYTPNRGKMKIYERQDREVDSWYALGAAGALATTLLAAFNLLPAAVRSRKFRAAITNAAAMGDTVDKAIARFEAGIAANDQLVLNLEAIEQRAVKNIKAAATAAAKRAAFAAIDWTWAG